MSDPAVPSWTGVGLSTVLVVLAVAVTAHRRLGISADLLLAAARAAVQLAAVAVVLVVVFDRLRLPGAMAWIAVMIALAGQVAGRRAPGLPAARPIATGAIALGTLTTLGLLVGLRVISITPHVLIPVAGMVVSGAMQAAGLSLLRVRDQVTTQAPAIEARLSLALPADLAFAPEARTAARTALLPAIDATKVVGLISLPGAMTGLILAGVDPLTAIRYQIVVMYMLLAAAAVTALLATVLAQRALFDDAHRLRAQLPPAPE
jgi:putative ABC transport system permease protein